MHDINDKEKRNDHRQNGREGSQPQKDTPSGENSERSLKDQGQPAQVPPVTSSGEGAGGEKGVPDSRFVKKETQPFILRFRSSERWLHWGIAVPFMVCWISGFILVFIYNPNPQLPSRAVFLWIHRISGLCLIVLPVAFFIKGRKDFRMHLYNIRTAWSWSVSDLKWIALMLPATVSRKFVLPDQDKFNAAEKVNFMSGMVGLPLLITTGVLIWMHQWAWQAWIVHTIIAIILTPIILGHIFMATVNPDTKVGLSGMISGYVNRQWAKHHYALWYKEFFENARAGRNFATPVYRPLSHRITVNCPNCAAKLYIFHSELTEAAISGISLDCPACRKPVPAFSLVEDEQMRQWIVGELKRRGKAVPSKPKLKT